DYKVTYPPNSKVGAHVYIGPGDLSFAFSAASDVKKKSTTVKVGVNWGLDVGASAGVKGAAEAYAEAQPRVEGSATLGIGAEGPVVDASIVFKADLYAGVKVDLKALGAESNYRFLLASGTFLTIDLVQFLKDKPSKSAVRLTLMGGLEQLIDEFVSLCNKISNAPELVLEALTEWTDVDKPGHLGKKLDRQLKEHEAARSEENKLLSSHKRYYEKQFESFRAAKNLAVLATLRDTRKSWYQLSAQEQAAKLDALLGQYMTDQENSRAMAQDAVNDLMKEGLTAAQAEKLRPLYINAVMHPGDRYTLTWPYKHSNADGVAQAEGRYQRAREQELQKAKQSEAPQQKDPQPDGSQQGEPQQEGPEQGEPQQDGSQQDDSAPPSSETSSAS
ncbi:MAG: proline-rich domain-containing protein, partial [Myxococcota bacterium]